MLNINIDKAYLTSLHGLNLDNAPRKYTDTDIGVICKYAKYRIQFITEDAENDDLTLAQIEAMKEAMAVLAIHWIQNGWDTTRVSGSSSIGGASFSSSNPDEPAYIPHLAIEILSSAGLYESLLPSSPTDRVGTGRGCGCGDDINQLPANWMTLVDNYMASKLNGKENRVDIPTDATSKDDYLAIWNQHGRFLLTIDQMASKMSPDKGLYSDLPSTIDPTTLLSLYTTGITLFKDGQSVRYIKGGVNEFKAGDQLRVQDKTGMKTYTFTHEKKFAVGSTATGALDPEADYKIGTVTKKIREWFALWNDKQDKIVSAASQAVLTTAGYAKDTTKGVVGDFSVEDIQLWLSTKNSGTFMDNANGDHGLDVDKVAIITASLSGPEMEHALEEAFKGHKPPEIQAYELVTTRWLLAVYEALIDKLDHKQDIKVDLTTQTALTAAGYKANTAKGIAGDFSVEDIQLWLTSQIGDFDLDIKGVTKKISEWVEKNKDDIQLLSSPLKFKEYDTIAAAVADKGTTGFDNPSLVLIKGTTPKIYVARDKVAFTDTTGWTEIPLTLRTHQNENGEAGWLITDIQIASDKLTEAQVLAKLREIEKGNLVAGLGDFELVNAEHLAWVLKAIDNLKFKDNLAGETGPMVHDTAIATSNSAGTTQMTIDEYKTEIEKSSPTKWGQNELAKMIHIKGLYEILKLEMKPVDIDDKAAFDKAFNDAKDGTPLFGIVRDLAGFPATVFADKKTHTGIGIFYLNKAVGVSLDDVKIWIPGGGKSVGEMFREVGDSTKTFVEEIADLLAATDLVKGETISIKTNEFQDHLHNYGRVVVKDPHGATIAERFEILNEGHAESVADIGNLKAEVEALKTAVNVYDWKFELAKSTETTEAVSDTATGATAYRLGVWQNDDDYRDKTITTHNIKIPTTVVPGGVDYKVAAAYKAHLTGTEYKVGQIDLSVMKQDKIAIEIDLLSARTLTGTAHKIDKAYVQQAMQDLYAQNTKSKEIGNISIVRWSAAFDKLTNTVDFDWTKIKWTVMSNPTSSSHKHLTLFAKKTGNILEWKITNDYDDSSGEQGADWILANLKVGVRLVDSLSANQAHVNVVGGGGIDVAKSTLNGNDIFTVSLDQATTLAVTSDLTLTKDAVAKTETVGLSTGNKAILMNARTDHQSLIDLQKEVTDMGKDVAGLGSIGHFGGTFATTADRDTKYPTPTEGTHVLVGATAPFQEYTFTKGAWTAGGTSAGIVATPHNTVTVGKGLSKTETTNANGSTNYEIIADDQNDIVVGTGLTSTINSVSKVQTIGLDPTTTMTKAEIEAADKVISDKLAKDNKDLDTRITHAEKALGASGNEWTGTARGILGVAGTKTFDLSVIPAPAGQHWDFASGQHFTVTLNVAGSTIKDAGLLTVGAGKQEFILDATGSIHAVMKGQIVGKTLVVSDFVSTGTLPKTVDDLRLVGLKQLVTLEDKFKEGSSNVHITEKSLSTGDREITISVDKGAGSTSSTFTPPSVLPVGSSALHIAGSANFDMITIPKWVRKRDGSVLDLMPKYMDPSTFDYSELWKQTTLVGGFGYLFHDYNIIELDIASGLMTVFDLEDQLGTPVGLAGGICFALGGKLYSFNGTRLYEYIKGTNKFVQHIIRTYTTPVGCEGIITNPKDVTRFGTFSKSLSSNGEFNASIQYHMVSMTSNNIRHILPAVPGNGQFNLAMPIKQQTDDDWNVMSLLDPISSNGGPIVVTNLLTSNQRKITMGAEGIIVDVSTNFISKERYKFSGNRHEGFLAASAVKHNIAYTITGGGNVVMGNINPLTIPTGKEAWELFTMDGPSEQITSTAELSMLTWTDAGKMVLGTSKGRSIFILK